MKAGAGRFRSIAVTVREGPAGSFAWVLLEQDNDESWLELQASSKVAKTYRRAMADGLLALQALIEDLDAGPRDDVQEASGDKPKGSHAFFGFGPI